MIIFDNCVFDPSYLTQIMINTTINNADNYPLPIFLFFLNAIQIHLIILKIG